MRQWLRNECPNPQFLVGHSTLEHKSTRTHRHVQEPSDKSPIHAQRQGPRPFRKKDGSSRVKSTSFVQTCILWRQRFLNKPYYDMVVHCTKKPKTSSRPLPHKEFESRAAQNQTFVDSSLWMNQNTKEEATKTVYSHRFQNYEYQERPQP